jgi:hypothetical protein
MWRGEVRAKCTLEWDIEYGGKVGGRNSTSSESLKLSPRNDSSEMAFAITECIQRYSDGNRNIKWNLLYEITCVMMEWADRADRSELKAFEAKMRDLCAE